MWHIARLQTNHFLKFLFQSMHGHTNSPLLRNLNVSPYTPAIFNVRHSIHSARIESVRLLKLRTNANTLWFIQSLAAHIFSNLMCANENKKQ